MMKYEQKIREIIGGTIETDIPIETYDANGDLRSIGMNSITFISMVVAIEDAFSIRFPDEKLILEEAGTIAVIHQIVEDSILKKQAFE